MGHRKNKNNPRIFSYVLALFVVVSPVGFFYLFYKEPASLYVFPENSRQGDTVFIRVKSDANSIMGNFNNQKLAFYKKNSNEWISFLGIDADQKPADYKILVAISPIEKLTKNIIVSPASFSSSVPVQAPNVTQNGINQPKAVDNIIKNDNPAIKKFLSNFTPQPYFTAPFSYPLNAMRRSGFSFGKFLSFGKYVIQHFGVDLKAPKETDIYAINDGRVVATLDLPNYGKTVIIDHGLDIFSLYLHLDRFDVSSEQIVKRGQPIGLSGDTGYVTAPHLHFSIRVGDSRVDPVTFIETTQKMNDNFILADINNAFLDLINQIK